MLLIQKHRGISGKRLEVDGVKRTPLVCSEVMIQNAIAYKAIPERLQRAATRKEVIGNPRYRLPYGIFIETEVDGPEFSVYLLGSSPHAGQRRIMRLSGRIARNGLNGGSEISALFRWMPYQTKGLVLMGLLGLLPFVIAAYPPRNPPFGNPVLLSFALCAFLVLSGVYAYIRNRRLMTDFLRDLLEAEVVRN